MRWFRERKIYFSCAKCGYQGYVSPQFTLTDRHKNAPCPQCQTVSTIHTKAFNAVLFGVIAFAALWGMSALTSSIFGLSPSVAFGIAVVVFLVLLFCVRRLASRVLYGWEVRSLR
jgi:Zn ribbon nucleic-acid-binding protein